jgi:hypothetical protein
MPRRNSRPNSARRVPPAVSRAPATSTTSSARKISDVNATNVMAPTAPATRPTDAATATGTDSTPGAAVSSFHRHTRSTNDACADRSGSSALRLTTLAHICSKVLTSTFR